jgi:hypothetical protein
VPLSSSSSIMTSLNGSPSVTIRGNTPDNIRTLPNLYVFFSRQLQRVISTYFPSAWSSVHTIHFLQWSQCSECSYDDDDDNNNNNNNNNSMSLISERTLTTAACRRSQCQLLWIKGVAWSARRIPYGRILGFLDRSCYFFFQVAPQLYSQGWMDPVPDPLPLRKSGSAENRVRASGSEARNSDD